MNKIIIPILLCAQMLGAIEISNEYFTGTAAVELTDVAGTQNTKEYYSADKKTQLILNVYEVKKENIDAQDAISRLKKIRDDSVSEISGGKAVIGKPNKIDDGIEYMAIDSNGKVAMRFWIVIRNKRMLMVGLYRYETDGKDIESVFNISKFK